VVLVTADGQVENRVIEVPAGLPPSALVQAGNYLNARLSGRTLDEARASVQAEIAAHRTALDELTQQVIAAGLATWSGGGVGGTLILRGQAKLLQNLDEQLRVREIQALFDRLETQETMLRLLDLAQRGEGVQIFIGAESGLFDSAGLSMVVAPFRNAQDQRIVGAIGVVGPARINYGRIVPVVDYTARVIGRLLG
jgi:heat-inducible transcriptional repressor